MCAPSLSGPIWPSWMRARLKGLKAGADDMARARELELEVDRAKERGAILDSRWDMREAV